MIEIHDLVKRYGAQTAVDHLDLTIEAGQVCGLLGLNGAGKTTLFNNLTGSTSMWATGPALLWKKRKANSRAIRT